LKELFKREIDKLENLPPFISWLIALANIFCLLIMGSKLITNSKIEIPEINNLTNPLDKVTALVNLEFVKASKNPWYMEIISIVGVSVTIASIISNLYFAIDLHTKEVKMAQDQVKIDTLTKSNSEKQEKLDSKLKTLEQALEPLIVEKLNDSAQVSFFTDKKNRTLISHIERKWLDNINPSPNNLSSTESKSTYGNNLTNLYTILDREFPELKLRRRRFCLLQRFISPQLNTNDHVLRASYYAILGESQDLDKEIAEIKKDKEYEKNIKLRNRLEDFKSKKWLGDDLRSSDCHNFESEPLFNENSLP